MCTVVNDQDGLHGRDDWLLNIIACLGGLVIERNTRSDSTVGRSRADAFLYAAVGPPLVYMEEKASPFCLIEAKNDLTTKFRLTPHYGSLPYVCGIAVAGDFICIGRLDGAGHFSKETNFDLNHFEDRLR